MRLKKLFAVIAAAALTAAMCLPVAADETATQGQVAQGDALELIGMTQDPNMDVSAAEQKMEKLTATLQDKDVTLSSEMMTAALAFFDRMENDQQSNIQKDAVEESDGVELYYRSEDGDSMTLNSVSMDNNGGKIVLDADGSGQTAFGYAITVELPANTNVTKYKITMLGNDAQQIDAVVPVTSYIDENNVTHHIVTFWVPHFTTYELTTYTTSTVSGSDGSGSSSDQTSTTQTSSGNKEATATQNAIASAAEENPIKATGSDMSMVVFAVVALAGVAACVMGIASKKSRKSK